MRKLFLSISLLIALTVSSFAQDNMMGDNQREKGTYTPSGQQILPTEGDFGISVSADPILKYLGNAFNGSTENEAPIFENTNIMGRYFITSDNAIRFGVGIDVLKSSLKKDVPKIVADGENASDVTDISKINYTKIDLSLGYEFRKGYGRLQGFFGPQAMVSFSKKSESFEYGNPISEKNAASRVLYSTTNGSIISLSAGGFVGVEYFFAPKMSISAEYSLFFKYRPQTKSKIDSESWNSETKTIDKKTTESYSDSILSSSVMGVSTNSFGSIKLSFYF